MNLALNNSNQITCNLSNFKSNFINISISGKLAANSKDNRLLIRVNGGAKNYKSFAVMDGTSHKGEWDETGLYIGRNGWALDADFSAFITLSYMAGAQKIVSSGRSTFIMGNNSILGYYNHGFYISNSGISNIDIVFIGGGLATGNILITEL